MLHGDITYVDEALYENKLSVVYDDRDAARETLDRVREFVRSNPTVYCGTHTPQSFPEFAALCRSKKIKPVRTMEERERDLIANGFGDMLDDGLRKCWQDEIDLYGNIHQEKVIFD